MHRNRFLLASIINFALALFCTSGLNAQTFKRGDFTATNAFYWSDVDLSAYAGTDSGSTPYQILLTDGAGKTASGFIGAVGAGETLSPTELLLDPTFDDTLEWIKGTNWTVSGGKAIAAVVSWAAISADANHVFGQLWKGTVICDALTTGSFQLQIQWSLCPTIFNTTGTKADYLTCLATEVSRIGICGYTSNSSGTFTDASFKRVLDPPSTGVHIVSAYGGSTRAWTSIDSGFNPNTITSALLSQEDEDRLILPAIKKVIKKTTKNVIKR